MDGVYSINPDGRGTFKVRCDMSTSGGGWTIFQRRIDGSVDFFRYWVDYKNGFGDPAGEYWLGLDKINRLTNSGTRNILRVDLMDTIGITKYAEYNFFSVASETAKYKLGLGTYSGTIFCPLYKIQIKFLSDFTKVHQLQPGAVCIKGV